MKATAIVMGALYDNHVTVMRSKSTTLNKNVALFVSNPLVSRVNQNMDNSHIHRYTSATFITIIKITTNQTTTIVHNLQKQIKLVRN